MEQVEPAMKRQRRGKWKAELQTSTLWAPSIQPVDQVSIIRVVDEITRRLTKGSTSALSNLYVPINVEEWVPLEYHRNEICKLTELFVDLKAQVDEMLTEVERGAQASEIVGVVPLVSCKEVYAKVLLKIIALDAAFGMRLLFCECGWADMYLYDTMRLDDGAIPSSGGDGFPAEQCTCFLNSSCGLCRMPVWAGALSSTVDGVGTFAEDLSAEAVSPTQSFHSEECD